VSQAWWQTPINPTVKRLRQEDHELEGRLDYTVRLCLQKQQGQNFVTHACNPNYVEFTERRVTVQENLKPYLKNNLKQNMTGGVVQIVECFPSKPTALSSNPNTTKNQPNKRNASLRFTPDLPNDQL
jgi:hypothetical protein